MTGATKKRFLPEAITLTAETFDAAAESHPPLFRLALIKTLIEWAEADETRRAVEFPDWGEWKQTVWAEEVRNGVCKTAFCMAGQTVVQAGYDLVLDLEDEWDDPVETVKVYGASRCVTPLGERGIDAVAKETLGLTRYEAGEFFDGANHLPTLKRMTNQMCYDRGLPPPYPGEGGWSWAAE